MWAPNGKKELMANACYGTRKVEQSGLQVCEAGHGIVHLCNLMDGNSDSGIGLYSNPPQSTY